MPDIHTLLDEAATTDARLDHARVERSLARRHRMRRLALSTATVAAVVGLGAAGLAVAVADDGPEPRDVVAGPGPDTASSTTSSTTSAEGPTTVVDDGRIWSTAAVAWTGAEVVVWGGEGPEETALATGVAYDPATGEQRPIPDGPLGPSHSATAVWDGTSVLVCCGEDGNRAAAYDPVEDAWRELAPPALEGVMYPASVWTGSEMVVVGGVNEAAADRLVAAYDPERDTWRSLPAPPIILERDATLLWTGEEVIAVGGALSHGGAAALDPEQGTWTVLPTVPPEVKALAAAVVWTGEEVLAWGVHELEGTRAVGARYVPGSEAWSALPEAPLSPIDPTQDSYGSIAAVWIDDAMVACTGAFGRSGSDPAGLAFDPAEDAWRPVTALTDCDGARMVAAGDDIVLLGSGGPVVVDPGAG